MHDCKLSAEWVPGWDDSTGSVILIVDGINRIHIFRQADD